MYVRNNDYLTAEKIREVSQLRSVVVGSFFPLATRESRRPTIVSPFHSFGKFPRKTSNRGSKIQKPMLLPRRKS